MSTRRKVTKRRDTDAVRVYEDGRVAYWTGGKPGEGARKFERHTTLEAAEVRADELRARFRCRQYGAAPHPDTTLDGLMQDLLDHLRSVDAPEGTTRAYKADWNTWIGDVIGTVPCRETELHHWSAVFAALSRAKVSENKVKAIARTLGAVVGHGIEHGFFVGHEGFVVSPQRSKVIKKARKIAAVEAAEKGDLIDLDVCPTVADVNQYAEAMEVEYPDYGARLVWLAFGSGLRINELLALRHDSIDLTNGHIAVDWQLNRYGNWPALKRPKGGKTRTTILWRCYSEVARSLVEDSLARKEDHGWLFPRHRSVTKWADQAGKLAGDAKDECKWVWTFHWLRHGFTTWSMAPKAELGQGRSLESVSAWLGHRRTSTTLDIYVQRRASDVEDAWEATGHLPGTPR